MERVVWEELKTDLIYFDIEAENYNEVFEKVGGSLVEKGYGKADYVKGLIEREDEYPTGLDINGFGIAIPHTPVTYVNKPATAIGILKEPVRFVEMGTDDDAVDAKLVFVLAVTDPKAHIDQLQRIIAIIQDKDVLEEIYSEREPAKIIHIIKAKEEKIEKGA